MSEVADRVTINLANEILAVTKDRNFVNQFYDCQRVDLIAAALSSHGLKWAVEALEKIKSGNYGSNAMRNVAAAALTALLGDGESPKPKEQADGR